MSSIDITPSFADQVEAYIDDRLAACSDYADNCARLADAERRSVELRPGIKVELHHLPSRRRSSGADLSDEAIAARRCFLCADIRPKWQGALTWADYDIVVNPYPVLPRHLTVIHRSHRPQTLDRDTIREFAALALMMPRRILFYNGAKCGASAPDHLHFQSIPDFLHGSTAFAGTYLISPPISDADQARQWIERSIISLGPALPGETEPRFNLAALPADDAMRFVLFPRNALRPSVYSVDPLADPAHGCMVSPATVEMLGIIVTPLKKDFDRLDADTLRLIFSEVSAPLPAPSVDVGIVAGQTVKVKFNGEFICGKRRLTGSVEFHPSDLADGELLATPCNPKECSFELGDVTIGVDFHWQRRESQRFAGSLRIVDDGGVLYAVNRIGIEEYLRSVVSSEMSARASLEFLKAHAVISRSWALSQLEHREQLTSDGKLETPEEVIRWHDRDNHTLFDLCADDHCQRYQGLGRVTTSTAGEAVDATRGLVLTDGDGRVFDARFSKCCGGEFERFSTCWQPVDFDGYATGADIPDEPPHLTPAPGYAGCFDRPACDTSDRKALEQVMNSYDNETTDFYRWSVDYTPEQLADIIRRRSGIDFGEILAIEPLGRGPSGRISRLRITGRLRSIIVGKELEIRRWLSESHLKSSAFDVSRDSSGNWHFEGRGWGHGVGLCQIGAAMMALHGYDYRQILHHYYPGCKIAENYGR